MDIVKRVHIHTYSPIPDIILCEEDISCANFLGKVAQRKRGGSRQRGKCIFTLGSGKSVENISWLPPALRCVNFE